MRAERGALSRARRRMAAGARLAPAYATLSFIRQSWKPVSFSAASIL